jgi:hypothetical protein
VSIQELYREIRSLSERDREQLLLRLLVEPAISDEIERLGYLRLTERAFDFWNDPREDLYQDFARSK